MTAGTASAPARGLARAVRLALLIVLAALVTSSCAAGQHAQTVEVKGSIDAGGGNVGQLLVEGVALHSPLGSSYPVGSSVQLAVTIANNGNRADTLVNVTSPAFTSWAIFPNARATATSSSGGDTGITIGAHSAQRLGLADLGGSAQASPRTVILFGLTKPYAPLYPGSAVNITFHFANAGTGTIRVPVQIALDRPGQTLPGSSSSEPAEG